MTTYEAIKHTSNALVKLLKGKMEQSNVTVKISMPENGNGASNQINLYLLQVEENPNLKNHDLSRLWLNLNYLLIPYHTDEDQAHAILGDAIRVFHNNPVISPKTMVNVGTIAVPSIETVLNDNMKKSIEKIKITPYSMPLEELSKIWTALRGDFRLSVVYQVSVIQIDCESKQRYPAPVRVRHLDVIPFKYPEIAKIVEPRIFINDNLRLTGVNFYSENTMVKIDGVEKQPLSVSDIELVTKIPPETPPGPHIVEVLRKTGSRPGCGFSSNQTVFLLMPMIKEILIEKDANNIDYIRINGTAICKPDKMIPRLLLGQKSVDVDDSSNIDTVIITKDTIEGLEDDLPDHEVPIRLEVNGVESRGLKTPDGNNEWMWFYKKKSGATLSEKIIKKKFPDEVLPREYQNN